MSNRMPRRPPSPTTPMRCQLAYRCRSPLNSISRATFRIAPIHVKSAFGTLPTQTATKSVMIAPTMLSIAASYLKAGYGINPSVIFAGNITQAWSVREGADYVTTIECFVGGSAYINARTNQTFIAGTPIQTVVQSLVDSLSAYGISAGAIGTYTGTLKRDTTYSGNTLEILRSLTGGGTFIDQLKANCLNNGEYIDNLSSVTTVSSDSGLLGTPVQELLILNFDMIFEPRVNPGQKINLVSQTESNFNGQYKCISVKHRGMISAAVCGKVITTVGLQYIKNATPVASQNPSAPVIA